MKNKIYVWDPLVRFFHWTLVLAFTIAYLSGDEDSLLHVYSGYYILGLVAVRIVWGFIGTRYARFSQFIYPPATAIAYIKDLFSFKHEEQERNFIGHNPAGGWMVIALLLSLLATGYSGLKVYGLEGHGPLAANTATVHLQQTQGQFIAVSDSEDDNEHQSKGTDDFWEEIWEEIHEFLANFTLLLIALHIGGVLLSSKKHKQNLVKAMLTGYKEQDEQKDISH